MLERAQVKCEIDSLNQRDTFVLDCGRKIYVWIGPSSEKKERLAVREHTTFTFLMDCSIVVDVRVWSSRLY